VNVEQKMTELLERLEEHIDLLPVMAQNAGHSKAEYERLYSRAILRARYEEDLRTVEDRKAWASVETEKAMEAKIMAEARWDAEKRVVGVLQTQSDLLRSLSVSSRAGV
jgi:hypothetical protein